MGKENLKIPVKWLAGFLLLLAAVSVDARVIFDNGVTTITGFLTSDASVPHFGADDFVLQPGSNIITDIHWTGIYSSGNPPPETDDFTIEIFADDGGAPDSSGPLSVIDVGDSDRTDTGIDFGSFSLFSYSVFIAPLELTPNTSFWLSIINDTTPEPANWAWGGNSKVGGNGLGRTSSTFPWTPTGVEQDFQLTSVLEPTSLALLGLGLAGLSLVRKRR